MQPEEKVTITETEIKLQDTAIQFQLAITNADNEDVFRSCINSFVSGARSITMVMKRRAVRILSSWSGTNQRLRNLQPIR